MDRQKLLSEIKYALNYINYTEENEKQVKKAFKKMNQDLKDYKKMKNIIKKSVSDFSFNEDGTGKFVGCLKLDFKDLTEEEVLRILDIKNLKPKLLAKEVFTNETNKN